MGKQEWAQQVMDELNELLEQLTSENILLRNFVDEQGLTAEYEEYQEEVQTRYLQKAYSQDATDEQKKEMSMNQEKRDRKPVRVRLP